MHYLWLILSLVLLIWFWIRFLNQTFSHFPNQNAKKLLLRGIIPLWLLWLYQLVISKFWLEFWLSSIAQAQNFRDYLMFWSYIIAALCCLPLLFRQQSNRKIWLQILIGIGLVIPLFIFWSYEIGSRILIYYLLISTVEELLKFSLSHNSSETSTSTSHTKLLLIAITIGFSFWVAESLLALGLQLFSGESIKTWFLLGRGLLSVMLHILATGSIALAILKLNTVPTRTKYAWALLCGYLLHSSYNLWLHYQLWFISFLIAIGGFIWLSYLLFHLDELYLPASSQKTHSN